MCTHRKSDTPSRSATDRTWAEKITLQMKYNSVSTVYYGLQRERESHSGVCSLCAPPPLLETITGHTFTREITLYTGAALERGRGKFSPAAWVSQ